MQASPANDARLIFDYASDAETVDEDLAVGTKLFDNSVTTCVDNDDAVPSHAMCYFELAEVDVFSYSSSL